tara:strand:- start:48 stop:338 length:291 start_codon:yes stop_codon:yes gene_type:complete
MKLLIITLFSSIILASCTEETRQKFARSVQQNILGERLKVSYIDYGKVVKSWIIEDGKVTTGVTEGGVVKGYYYAYTTDGYIQLPIEKTLIEELKD